MADYLLLYTFSPVVFFLLAQGGAGGGGHVTADGALDSPAFTFLPVAVFLIALSWA